MNAKKNESAEYLDDEDDIEYYDDDESIDDSEGAECPEENEDAETEENAEAETIEYLDDDGEDNFDDYDFDDSEEAECPEEDEDAETEENAEAEIIEYLDDDDDFDEGGLEDDGFEDSDKTEYAEEDKNVEHAEITKANESENEEIQTAYNGETIETEETVETVEIVETDEIVEGTENSETAEADGSTEDSRRRKRKKAGIAALICLMLAVAAAAGGIYYISSLAYKVCRVEAGVSVSPSDFLKEPDDKAFFTQDSQPFDIAEPGEYKIKVKSGMFTHWCTLIIVDTIAPEAKPAQVMLEMGESCGAESFAADITDATQVKASYVEIPDFTKAGSQPVRITLTDKGNNQIVLDSELFISQAVANVTIEAGDRAPGLGSFIIEAKSASFITKVEALDYTKVGDYEVLLNADGQTYKSVLHIVDTIPPEIEVRDIEGYALVPVSTDAFTVSIEDITEVAAVFREEPDLSYIGTQDLEIAYTDGGNNEVVKQVKLTLIEDTEAPVIEGAVDLKVFIGDSVSYRKNVSVTDNCPDGLLMTVDTAEVNLNEEGVYPVTYNAKDLAGNTTSVTVNLTVTPRVYDINEVYAAADSVLASIITPEMSQLEQARAIFNYVTKHISYINDSVKDDWVRGAYEGLVYGKGDCFVFACTAKVLLTRAGIVNMDIEKIPAKTLHYWNLVDVGDGWYHFDTTPRKDHPVIFMWTDEQMMDYSEKHNKSHNYDHSLYPVVN